MWNQAPKAKRRQGGISLVVARSRSLEPGCRSGGQEKKGNGRGQKGVRKEIQENHAAETESAGR